MKVFVWILQVALALLALAGGAYKVFMFHELAKMPATSSLSRGAWTTLGIFEMVCAFLLIVPAATNWMPVLTPLAGIVLAIESVALAALYARHSLRMTATNPLVWVVLMAVIAAFVAYERYSLRPAP